MANKKQLNKKQLKKVVGGVGVLAVEDVLKKIEHLVSMTLEDFMRINPNATEDEKQQARIAARNSAIAQLTPEELAVYQSIPQAGLYYHPVGN